MTLKEQRMVSAHQMGRRDYHEGKPLIVPVFLKDKDESDAYRAGWIGEQKRSA